jgi:hypothetical protein
MPSQTGDWSPRSQFQWPARIRGWHRTGLARHIGRTTDAEDAGGAARRALRTPKNGSAREALNVPGYAIDKNYVNKFRRKSFWKSDNKFYDWNTSACHW